MRYTIIGIALLLVGCAGTKPMQETIYSTGFDFSEYTDEGFLITPEQYLGDYQSIGLITVTMWPKVYELPSSGSPGSENYTSSKWQIGELNVTKAIDEIYQQAKEMGADAITRFDVHGTERMNGMLNVPGAEISGFAIKRVNPQATN